MKIKITDLKGKLVKNIPCDVFNLNKIIENIKKEYPIGQYHAQLVTY